MNNGNYKNPNKVEMRKVYLDYIDEPKDSERRHRGDQHGIYDEYQIKMNANFSVRVVLFDVRYNKVPW
jgi:hypothetical protein